MFKKSIAALTASLLMVTQVALVWAQEKTAPATPPTSAQDQQIETVSVGSTVVQLDAVVTDKNGRRVNGLTAADFQVLDNDSPQKIDYFTAIEGSRALPMPATPVASSGDNSTTTNTTATNTTAAPISSLTVPYQGRHIALVFDDLNLSNDNFLRSRRAFTDYINNTLTPNDMVALISTGGALASMQQFTNDKGRLLSALNRIAAQTRTNDRGQQQVTMTDGEAIRIDSGDRTALQNVISRSAAIDAGPQGTIGNEPTGSVVSDSTGVNEARIRNAATARVREIGNKARINIDTLKSLFRGMSDLPGRKIVILMTEQFLTAGGTTEDISNQLTQLVEVARRAGISVYALDAAGLRTGSVSASEQITGVGLAFKNANPDLTLSSTEQLGGARILVAGTGGEVIANTNSLIAGLQRAIDDSSSYYVVGFKPNALDNKFHKLIVSIKGKPELTVRSRRGYLATNDETFRGTEAELLKALKSPVPLMDLPVDLVANVVPALESSIVVTGMHVGRNYLSLPPATASNQTITYEVVSYVFATGRDKPVAGVVKTLTYDLAQDPQQRQKLKTEGFKLVPEPFTQLEPGMYQMRAVIREKTSGAVGSAYQFFEVPDPKDHKTVSMSSLVLTLAGQSTFGGANSFKPGSDVDMRFVIYNLPKDSTGLTQRVKLIDAQGKVLFDSILPIAPAMGADKYQAAEGTQFNLPPMRDRYAIVVSLKDAKGKIDVERRADLVIE